MRGSWLTAGFRRFFGLLSVLITAVHLGAAQSTMTATSGEVYLDLSCPVSPCRFQQGEVVPIDLIFSADAPGYVVFSSYTGRFEFKSLDKVWNRFTVHYTSNHGSWLNQSGIHIGYVSSATRGGSSKVQHWSRRWYVGATTPGVGVLVQTDTFQKYVGKADRL